MRFFRASSAVHSSHHPVQAVRVGAQLLTKQTVANLPPSHHPVQVVISRRLIMLQVCPPLTILCRLSMLVLSCCCGPPGVRKWGLASAAPCSSMCFTRTWRERGEGGMGGEGREGGGKVRRVNGCGPQPVVMNVWLHACMNCSVL